MVDIHGSQTNHFFLQVASVPCLITSTEKQRQNGHQPLLQRGHIPVRPTSEAQRGMEMHFLEALVLPLRFSGNPTSLMNMTLLIFTIYLSRAVWDVIIIVIMDGKINVGIGEHKCQQVSGSLGQTPCHLIHNPQSQPLNLAFCDVVTLARLGYY